MKFVSIFALTLFLFLSGCTNIAVREIDSQKYAVRHVCIQENPRVNVSDFISVLEDKFLEHGITSEVFEGSAAPQQCRYIVRYTAKRSWDITHYIGYAEIKIYDRNKKIGSATYKQTGGSASLSLNKWGSTLEKIGPVIDELLSQFDSGSI